MKVEEFDLKDYLTTLNRNPNLRREYFSQPYGKTFSLVNGVLVKLDPIDKERIADTLKRFNNSINNFYSNYELCPQNLRPSEHFLFRYRVRLRDDSLHIWFRTKSENDLIDSFLESIQESNVLRHNCETDELKDRLRSFYGPQFEEALKKCSLLEDLFEELKYVKRGIKKEWITSGLSNFFDAVGLMEHKGYELREILRTAENVCVYPNNQFNRIIWNQAISTLRK